MERGKKGLVDYCLCDYNAAFAGRARRRGVAVDAGLVFGQVKMRKGCVGGGFWGRGSGIERWRASSARRCFGVLAAVRSGRGPVGRCGDGRGGAAGCSGRSPLSACRGNPAGARPMGATSFLGVAVGGPALCSDAVEPNARRLFR